MENEYLRREAQRKKQENQAWIKSTVMEFVEAVTGRQEHRRVIAVLELARDALIGREDEEARIALTAIEEELERLK